MREIRPSGSEGGAGFNPRSLPLSQAGSWPQGAIGQTWKLPTDARNWATPREIS
jgi:hypothetical protein